MTSSKFDVSPIPQWYGMLPSSHCTNCSVPKGLVGRANCMFARPDMCADLKKYRPSMMSQQ